MKILPSGIVQSMIKLPNLQTDVTIRLDVTTDLPLLGARYAIFRCFNPDDEKLFDGFMRKAVSEKRVAGGDMNPGETFTERLKRCTYLQSRLAALERKG